MKWNKGGTTVPRGMYFNLKMWEFVQLYEGTPVLPGGAEVKYLKVPAALTVLAGPLAGLVFILFLPFVGIVGLASFLGYKAGRAVFFLTRRTLYSAAVEWKPGTAYLAKRGGAPKPKADAELDKLEEEVTRKRQEKKE